MTGFKTILNENEKIANTLPLSKQIAWMAAGWYGIGCTIYGTVKIVQKIVK